MKTISAIAQTFILTGFSVLSLFAISSAQAASFAGLGGFYYPSGVSADGSVLVGLTLHGYPDNRYRNEASRWTQSSGV